jgi:glycosyltransferase involved in cell wall biosynthesis
MLIGRKTIGTVAYMGGILTLPEPFVKAWSEMVQYNYEYLLQPTERIFYDRATVSYHSFARNSIVDRMQGDWVFMLDTDIVFEPDVVARMLHKMAKHDIQVLAGMYPYKSYPHAPVMYGRSPKTKYNYILGDWDKTVEVMQIHSAGAGCLMIKKSVIDAMKQKKWNPFDIIEPFSEDHSFFERLHKLKIPAYCDTTLQLSHLTYKYLTVEKDYPKDKMKIGKKVNVHGFK